MNTEIEVRFLEIDKEALILKLKGLSAVDSGRKFLKEIILYNESGTWKTEHKRMRVRQAGDQVYLTYKAGNGVGMQTTEHEVVTSDFDQTVKIMELAGLQAERKQEKYRHSFIFNNALIEIDDWPGIPTYMEIEGSSVQHLEETAVLLGFDWASRTEKDAYWVIKEEYGIDLYEVAEFTFEKFGK